MLFKLTSSVYLAIETSVIVLFKLTSAVYLAIETSVIVLFKLTSAAYHGCDTRNQANKNMLFQLRTENTMS